MSGNSGEGADILSFGDAERRRRVVPARTKRIALAAVLGTGVIAGAAIGLTSRGAPAAPAACGAVRFESGFAQAQADLAVLQLEEGGASFSDTVVIISPQTGQVTCP